GEYLAWGEALIEAHRGRQEAEPATYFERLAAGIETRDRGAPRSRAKQGCKTPERGGLAGAVRTQNCIDLPRRAREGEAANGEQFAVPLRKIIEDDHRPGSIRIRF